MATLIQRVAAANQRAAAAGDGTFRGAGAATMVAESLRRRQSPAQVTATVNRAMRAGLSTSALPAR